MTARTRSYARDLLDQHIGPQGLTSRLHPEFARPLEQILPAQCREPHSKSLALLEDWLTPKQLQQFQTKNYFDVTGSAGGKYRINGAAGGTVPPYNIHVLADNNDMCIVPDQGGYMVPMLPVGDILLVQKIALETDEEGALDKANWRRPQALFRFVDADEPGPMGIRRVRIPIEDHDE